MLAGAAFAKTGKVKQWQGLWKLSFFGVLISTYLTIARIVALDAVCGWCLTSFALLVVIFGLAMANKPSNGMGLRPGVWWAAHTGSGLLIVGAMFASGAGLWSKPRLTAGGAGLPRYEADSCVRTSRFLYNGTMKLTPELIAQISQEPEYRNLPRELIISNTEDDNSWKAVLKESAKMGARVIAWQYCHMLANLFDTYPIETVGVGVKLKVDSSTDTLNAYVLVDGRLSNPDEDEEHPFFDVAEDIDGMEMLRTVVEFIENSDIDELGDQVWQLHRHLPTFYCAKQARDSAANAFPEMESFAKAWMLRRLADEAEPSTQDKPRKPGM